MAKHSVYEKQLERAPKKGILRLLEIAGTKRVYLILGGVLSIIAVMAQMSPYVTIYLLVRELVDHVGNLQSVDRTYVWMLGRLTLIGLAVYGILTYAGSMCSHVAAFNILYEIRTALASKLARLPMGFYTLRNSGEIKKILNEDVERIELFVAHHTIDIIQAIFLPIVSMIFLFIVDWRLAIGTLLPVPLALTAQFSMYTKSGMKMYEQWQEKLAIMNGTIVEYVRGMPVVKIFNQSINAFKRFSNDVYAYKNLTIEWIKISATQFSAFLTLLSSSAVFILPIAVFLIRRGGISDYGDFVSTVFLFLFIGMGIAVPLYKMMYMSSYLIQMTTGLSGIDDILTSDEITEPSKPETPQGTTIEFCNVSFAYNDENVLNDISFTVDQGTITALVGPSGGGKTTVASLISRFWDIQEGEILIGGTNIKNMTVETLNNTVSAVFQDGFLFFDTIEENIRMGNSSATFEEVVQAAKAAQIHNFIETLPQGYKTFIGEGGTYLSGGEQQRISLARAVLKDAPIVILDEATAYADPENESHIQEALSVVLEGKTVIIIAHRLYTITDVDQILVINEGVIEEQGTHNELLSNKGLYRELWEIHTRARGWNIDKSEGRQK